MLKNDGSREFVERFAPFEREYGAVQLYSDYAFCTLYENLRIHGLSLLAQKKRGKKREKKNSLLKPVNCRKLSRRCW